jgi:serine protease Do
MKPGTALKLDLIRKGEPISLTVTIGTFDEDEGNRPSKIQESKLGIEVESLTPEIARNLGVADLQGVVITKVFPGSPAAWAGLAKGTVIAEVNQIKVTNPSEFQKAVNAVKPGVPILLLVKQGEMMLYITIRVG